MESPEAKNICVQIEQLLSEIRTLKIQQDDDVQKATYIQCEIHRKFAILEWIQSLSSKLERTPELEKMWTLVTAERVNAKATKNDLKKMPIPEHIQEEAKQEEEEEPNELQDAPFPFMDLPKLLVMEKVLDYLTDPQDKMSIMKAIPTTGQLMGWDKTTLLFESVLPILIKQVTADGYPLLHWVDLYNLGRVTPYARDLIRKDYQDKLLISPDMPDHRKSAFGSSHLEIVLERIGGGVDDPQWARSSIFPHGIFVVFRTTEEDQNHLMACLEQVGNRICDCTLYLELAKTSIQTVENLAKILCLIPQVSSLKIILKDNRPSDTVENEEWQENVENLKLPELPSLKQLFLDGYKPEIEMVMMALLEKYGRGLHNLVIEGSCGNVKNSFPVSSPNLKINCPNLVSVRFYWPGGNLQHILFLLNLLADSPLKTVGVQVADETVGKEFPRLLILLGTHFGKTLEHLHLQLDYDRNPGYDYLKDDIPPTWMLDMTFSKLKVFMVDGFLRPNGWNILLLFPALEKLECQLIDILKTEVFGGENLLEISFNSKMMRMSNVWKILPHLNSYFGSHRFNTSNGRGMERCSMKR